MEENFRAVPIHMKSIREENLDLLRIWEHPSHEGWLVILCEIDEYEVEEEELSSNSSSWKFKKGDCFLWYPSTSQTIMLPSLLHWIEEGYILFWDCCVLTYPPTNPNFMVFFLFRKKPNPNLFLYCYPGEKQWRRQELSLSENELFWSKASNKLYIASTHRDKFHEIQKLEPQLSFKSFSVTDNNCQFDIARFSRDIHYVECGDELFKVVRVYYPIGLYYEPTFCIKVSTLSLAYSWEQVESMGDHVIFIGQDTRASFSATKLGLTKGCVYFTQPCDEKSLYRFDLEDDSIYVYSYSSNLLAHLNLRPDSMLKVMEKRTSSVGRPTNISPCLVFLRKRERILNFVDYNNGNKHHIELSELLSGAEIRFSKGGWLLMLRGLRVPFFLNPFTRETIRLPYLPTWGIVSGLSFSSLPTSLDCVVFVIQNSYSFESFVQIYSISRGDKRWKLNSFPDANLDSGKKFLSWLNNPVFFDGAFYCLDREGTLGIFKKEKEGSTWKVLARPERPCNSFVDKSFLVECEGELLSVFIGHLGENVRIFRLDSSNMNWVKVESLQKHILFISETSSMSVIAPSSLMGNKIYFDRLHSDGVLYYCLNTSRYYTLEGQRSAENFYDTKRHLNCSWIEPNRSHSTDHELDWNSCELSLEKLVIS